MSPKQRTELAALARLPDKAIDTHDIPELTNWEHAEIGKFYRPRKQIVTMRLDAGVCGVVQGSQSKVSDRG